MSEPRARVTITFEYPIDLDYYEEGSTVAEAIQFDQDSYNEGAVSVGDILEWSVDEDISVVVEAVGESS